MNSPNSMVLFMLELFKVNTKQMKPLNFCQIWKLLQKIFLNKDISHFLDKNQHTPLLVWPVWNR